MNKAIVTVALTMIFTCPPASSQCSTGINTGGGSCTAPDAPGMPYNQENQANQRYEQPIWENRWGAIAIDLTTLDAGTSDGKSSKSNAKKLAMESCMQDGSKKCKIVMTFFNQCAALATGNIISYSKAPTKDKAEDSALKGCANSNSCRIVYSACNYPVRIN